MINLLVPHTTEPGARPRSAADGEDNDKDQRTTQKHALVSQAWWYTGVTPALRRLRVMFPGMGVIFQVWTEKQSECG